MLSTPPELKLEYEKQLQEKPIQRTIWGVYPKWFRYYPDYTYTGFFCWADSND
jgi:hypothetical protein